MNGNTCLVNVVAMKSLRKLNLNSTYLSALTFEGLKVGVWTCATWYIQVYRRRYESHRSSKPKLH